MYTSIDISELVTLARGLGPHGSGHAAPGDPDYNAEYTRGQAELIAEAAGLPQEQIADVIAMITGEETGK